MNRYRHLVVGGGMAADAAVQALREADPQAEVGMVGAEAHPPYNRPPLSKGLWKGEPRASVFRPAPDPAVALHLGRRIVRLDPAAHRAWDDQGAEYAFDKLLLATGGAPRRLPGGEDRVIHFRTLDDYDRLRAAATPGAEIVAIGGGFIGSEIAAALALVGAKVTMVFPEAGVGARAFPADLSASVTDLYRARGVEVLAGQTVAGLDTRGPGLVVRTSGGRELRAAAVVAGLGIIPSVELARAAGLEVDDGIVVDERLRTSHPDIHAAGDVARVFTPALETARRVEHEDAALTMGRAAGLLMAGQGEPYRHLPFFYSDLFDLGYEAVGEVDARLETVSDWSEPLRRGVVYFRREGRVRGVLLWNAFGHVDEARALIADPRPVPPGDLRGRIRA